MENENNGVVEYNMNQCTQDDFDYFESKLDRICPDIDVEAKINMMLGWD
jgi:hypothetical protein